MISGCTTGSIVANNTAVPSAAANGNAAQAAKIVWQNTYGGSGGGVGSAVIRTSDGGYAIAGSMTFVGDKQTSTYGTYSHDYYLNLTKMVLLKTDANGKELWNRTYGTGVPTGSASSVVQTSDGGYAILGSSGAVSSVLVRTDANGNMAWNKTLGQGTHSYELASSLIQTSDGGYAITGGAGDTIFGFNVSLDKLDANGKPAWSKAYLSGSGRSIVQTKDGGYAIAGNALKGMSEPFLLKTDASGNMAWSKTYMPLPDASSGTSSMMDITLDVLSSVLQTSDGGYILSGTTGRISYNTSKGSTGSLNGSSTSGAGFNIDSKIFLIKTDANGNEVWNKTYGREGDYEGSSIVQADDGGYAILGYGNDLKTVDMSSMNLSSLLKYKIYLVKTDANGNQVWDSTYGGTGMNKGSSIVTSGDGGYVLTGATDSGGMGSSDIYLAKVA